MQPHALLFAALLLSAPCLFAGSFAPEWLKKIDGGRARSISSTADGDVVVAGVFIEKAQFGPRTLHGRGVRAWHYGQGDTFLAKYDKAGKLIFARRIAAGIRPVKIVVDPDGLITLAAQMFGHEVRPRVGTRHLQQTGKSDIIIARFSPKGRCLWVSRTEGDGEEQVNDLAFDSNGSCVFVGAFGGVSGMSGSQITAIGTADAMVGKLTVDGRVQWLRHGGSTGDTIFTGVSVVPGESIYTCGMLGNISNSGSFVGLFDSKTVSATGRYDALVAEYSPDGEIRSVFVAGATNAYFESISGGANGVLLGAGYFPGRTNNSWRYLAHVDFAMQTFQLGTDSITDHTVGALLTSNNEIIIADSTRASYGETPANSTIKLIRPSGELQGEAVLSGYTDYDSVVSEVPGGICFASSAYAELMIQDTSFTSKGYFSVVGRMRVNR